MTRSRRATKRARERRCMTTGTRETGERVVIDENRVRERRGRRLRHVTLTVSEFDALFAELDVLRGELQRRDVLLRQFIAECEEEFAVHPFRAASVPAS